MGGTIAKSVPHICLNASYLTLYPTTPGASAIGFNYWKYIYPIQFVLGAIGNGLNLRILLSKGFRSKTNFLLASMAFSDLGFLIILLPASIATSETLAMIPAFYIAYTSAKMHLISMANWFSAASIWIVLTVTLERLVAIKMPLRARNYWKNWKLVCTICGIYVGSLAITFYNHFSYRVSFYRLCNGTQVVSKMRSVERPLGNDTVSDSLRIYVRSSVILNSVLVIALPLAALFLLNLLLLLSLKKQHKSMQAFMGNTKVVSCNRRQSHDTQSTERKITIMVVAIVTTFTLANTPSMVIALIELRLGLGHFKDLAIMSNGLVVTGKVLNFFLYCMSSANFRKQSMRLMRSKSRLGRVLDEFNTRTSHVLSTHENHSSYHNKVTMKSQKTQSNKIILSKDGMVSSKGGEGVRARLPTADLILAQQSKALLQARHDENLRVENDERRCSMQNMPMKEETPLLNPIEQGKGALSLQELQYKGEKDDETFL